MTSNTLSTLLLFLASSSSGFLVPPGRTVDLNDFEAEWQCVVRLTVSGVDGQQLTGTGALMSVDDQWFVLTAAHLFSSDHYQFADGDRVIVSGGSRAFVYAISASFSLTMPHSPTASWKQAVVFLPPNYALRRYRGVYANDIALLWLRGNFDQLRNVISVVTKPSQLKPKPDVGETVELYGAGQAEIRGGRYRVVPCSVGLPPTTFCYVPLRKINLYPVPGDSGAPIMCTDERSNVRFICGVHIGGYDLDNSLQLATDLTRFRSWVIETAILCRLHVFGTVASQSTSADERPAKHLLNVSPTPTTPSSLSPLCKLLGLDNCMDHMHERKDKHSSKTLESRGATSKRTTSDKPVERVRQIVV